LSTQTQQQKMGNEARLEQLYTWQPRSKATTTCYVHLMGPILQ